MKSAFYLLRLIAVVLAFSIAASTATFAAGVIYVKWDSPTNGPGNDWSHGYHSIQAGINASTWKDVWVARGTYNEHITLKTEIWVYGGFAGTETSISQRPAFPRPDSDPYAAIIDGADTGRVVLIPANAGYHTAIDGFTIQNGWGDDEDADPHPGFGGGICCMSNGHATIANNLIRDNAVKYQYPWAKGGGGIAVMNCSPTIRGNVLRGNGAIADSPYYYTVYGGGIGCWGGSPVVSDNLFDGNDARVGGGAIYGVDATPYVSGNRFLNTRVWGGNDSGGAIRLVQCAGTIVGNTMQNNSRAGAVVFLENSSPVIMNNLMANNIGAQLPVTAIHCWNSSPAILNNTIIGNNDVGIRLLNSTAHISNNIVAFNQGGVCNDGGSAPTMRSNNFYGNTDYDYGVGLGPGTGDISLDPKFLNYASGDYHILYESPCRDAGYDDPIGLPQYDIDGQARVQGPAVDIGADECWGRIIHVSQAPSASDSNSGDTWQEAKRHIQTAINSATAPDRIWVARDTNPYYERITIKPGLSVFGGFKGTETDISERPAFPRPSPDPDETIIDASSGGSAVTIQPGASQFTRLDGFKITHGNAAYGGGLYCTAGSPTIANATFFQNSANEGGAIYLEAASPLIERCVFDQDIAINRGGGIHAHDYCYPTIRYCRFSNCQAQNIDGGAIFADGGGPKIAGNTIADCYAKLQGGAIRLWGSDAIITSNTIYHNTGAGNGGGIAMQGAAPRVYNNIIAFNSSGLYGSGGAVPEIYSNNVWFNTGYDYSGVSPGPGDIAADPSLAAPESGDFHLLGTSACVNAGLNSAPYLPDKDLDGQARKNGTVDIGADEFWPVVFVKKDGDDSRSGATWADAKKTVTAAMAVASATGEVWVAKGTYQERITAKADVALRGGFAGTESLASQRAPYNWPEPDVNLTTLDGAQLGTVVTVPAGAGLTTIVERFVLTNGKGQFGGGIACLNSSPKLSVLTIVSNSADEGGGVYCEGGTARIEKSVIQGNTAVNRGGGVHLHNVIAPTIADSFITQNTAQGGDGGGIFSDSGIAAITRCTVHQNTAGLAGGGIRLWNASAAITGNIIELNSAPYGPGIHCHQSSPDITNNTIVGNTATVFGGGIDCSQSSPRISNNIVAFNSAGIYQDSGAPVLHSNDVWGNFLYPYWGVLPGVGDIACDPLFADRAGRDYHISAVSCCYNTGWNTAPSMLPEDIDAQPRTQAGCVDIGADEVPPSSSAYSVSQAKLSPDNGHVAIYGCSATASFGGFFYMEEFGRQCGIRVEYPGHSVSAGMEVSAEGVVRTNADGERYIDALWCGVLLGDALKPLTMTNRSILGGDLLYDPVTHAGQQGVKGGQGINCIGLLLKTSGKVKYVHPQGLYFTVSDTSAWDLTQPPTDADGHPGIRVWCEGLSAPPPTAFVTVTGASSCHRGGLDLFPLLRPRTQQDIVVH